MVEVSWNLPAPPGFQGLCEDLPLHFYHRHLPHWRQDGATYFVTSRQADSLPQEKLRELQGLREEWERRHPSPRTEEHWEELARETTRRVDRWLDQGSGSCRLLDERAAKNVVDALHHFDGERYELDCYVVMPNHLHVIVQPLIPAEYPLEKILQSWKRHTSRNINAIFGQSGEFWQEESFDRIIRDEEHLWRCIQYIGRNPQNAELDAFQHRLWVRPSWQALGWQFEDQ